MQVIKLVELDIQLSEITKLHITVADGKIQHSMILDASTGKMTMLPNLFLHLLYMKKTEIDKQISEAMTATKLGDGA